MHAIPKKQLRSKERDKWKEAEIWYHMPWKQLEIPTGIWALQIEVTISKKLHNLPTIWSGRLRQKLLNMQPISRLKESRVGVSLMRLINHILPTMELKGNLAKRIMHALVSHAANDMHWAGAVSWLCILCKRPPIVQHLGFWTQSPKGFSAVVSPETNQS